MNNPFSAYNDLVIQVKEFVYADKDDYDGEFTATGINSVSLGYYKNKHKLPNGYKVLCQIGVGKRLIGDIKCSGCRLPAYPLDYSVFYREIGYIQIGDNEFAVIKKSNLLFLSIYFSAVILLAVVTAFSVTGYESAYKNSVLPENEKIVLPYSVTTKQHIDTKNIKFVIPNQQSIDFRANQRLQSFVFSNQKINPYYVVVQIFVDDELLYASEYIPPGSSVRKIELSRVMTAGTYSAIIRYYTYSFDSEIRLLDMYEQKASVVFA